MNWGKHVFEAATLIVAAAICALISNGMASRERKLVVVSQYSSPAKPNVAAGPLAGRVPAGEPAPTSTAPQSTATTPTTTRQAELPAAPPPTTDNRQPTTAKPQPAAGNRQPATTDHAPPAADNRPPIDRFPPHPDKAYTELHYADVAWLHEKGALFLDARRTSVYEDGHIAGARPFSVWESDIDDKVNKLYAERPDPAQQNQPIVAYCSGGECEDSHMLAQKLWGIQFNNVYVYKDGFPDWQAHGGAIDKGPKP